MAGPAVCRLLCIGAASRVGEVRSGEDAVWSVSLLQRAAWTACGPTEVST